MVLDHEAEHSLRRATITSILGMIGRAAQTLIEWMTKTEPGSDRMHGVSTDVEV